MPLVLSTGDNESNPNFEEILRLFPSDVSERSGVDGKEVPKEFRCGIK